MIAHDLRRYLCETSRLAAFGVKSELLLTKLLLRKAHQMTPDQPLFLGLSALSLGSTDAQNFELSFWVHKLCIRTSRATGTRPLPYIMQQI